MSADVEIVKKMEDGANTDRNRKGKRIFTNTSVPTEFHHVLW
jgi:hypothetical protein